jgi:hypothetical protein
VKGVEITALQCCLAEDGELQQSQSTPGAATAQFAQWLSAAVPADAARELWMAVGAGHDAAAMSALLRELRGAGFAVQGFADAAAAIVGWQRLAGAHIVLACGRAQMLLSVVVNDGHAVELQRTVHLPGGMARIEDAWVQLAAQTLVQQTRFDPLHDQRYERALRAALPGMAVAAARAGQASHPVDAAGRELVLTLTRDQFATAVMPLLQPAVSALQALAAGLAEGSVLLDAALAELPGAAALLDAAQGMSIRAVPAGSAACAVSLQAATAPLASGAVQYLTRVPVPGGTGPAPLPLLGADADRPVTMATHVVYRGRAIPIDAGGLVIGRDPGVPQALRLPEGVAGLSRRHCTLRRERGRTQVVDHSRFGSFIDGVRVRGRAFLAAGSVLRLGTPGIELPLVALADAATTP